MVSRMRAALCDQSRSCQPATMNGLEAPSATSISQPVSAATELAPNAIETGVRTLTGRGPTRKPKPGTRAPMAVANANASNVAISPIHSPGRPAALGGLGDFECLQVGPVQPQRQHRFDRRPHSMAASVVCPSRMRPGNSRDASFTWKCAVAVNASRKRRCSGAPS